MGPYLTRAGCSDEERGDKSSVGQSESTRFSHAELENVKNRGPQGSEGEIERQSRDTQLQQHTKVEPACEAGFRDHSKVYAYAGDDRG